MRFPRRSIQAWPAEPTYVWKVDGDDLVIETEYVGATLRGRWSDDGKVFSGGWRPNLGREDDPGNIPYDIWGNGRPAPEKETCPLSAAATSVVNS